MIFLSIRSKKVEVGPYAGFNGYVTWVKYRNKKYVLLYDECVEGDGLALQHALSLGNSDVLVLRGGAYEYVQAVYIEEKLAKKHGVDFLIGCVRGINFAAGILVNLGSPELMRQYSSGDFARASIVEPDAASDKKKITKAANRLKEQGLSLKKILTALEDDEELYEAGVMLPPTAAILKKWCCW